MLAKGRKLLPLKGLCQASRPSQRLRAASIDALKLIIEVIAEFFEVVGGLESK
jgi:hypothetical protein